MLHAQVYRLHLHHGSTPVTSTASTINTGNARALLRDFSARDALNWNYFKNSNSIGLTLLIVVDPCHLGIMVSISDSTDIKMEPRLVRVAWVLVYSVRSDIWVFQYFRNWDEV